MNITHKFYQIGFCLCLIVITGCASVSSQTPSVTELRQRAESGDTEAQSSLGQAYDFGQGVQQSYAEAFKWYQMAADHGDTKAQNNLGSFYQYGLGVATNYSQAASLYKQAAAQGLLMAESNLGYMYDNGLGVPVDKVTANLWYRRAADQGYPEAMLNLGINYTRSGEGVERDLSQAYMWIDCARWLTQFSHNMHTKWRIRSVLDDLEQHMTPEQIREGERLSKEWSENYLKTHK
jgi:TPR repeat protein